MLVLSHVVEDVQNPVGSTGVVIVVLDDPDKCVEPVDTRGLAGTVNRMNMTVSRGENVPVKSSVIRRRRHREKSHVVLTFLVVPSIGVSS